MHKALKTMLKDDIITPYTPIIRRTNSMRLDDMSKEARNLLEEFYILDDTALERKESLDKLLDNYVADSLDTADEIEEFITATKELKKGRYIKIKLYEPKFEGWAPSVESLKITLKGKWYLNKFKKYAGPLLMEYRERPLTMEYMFRKLAKNGYYIVLVAVIPVICAVIDTVINIINNSK